VIALRISLLGRQPHAALESIYNSADLFLLGSHHEGSGYAVLEALSCGAMPVITDIPSFRVLTDCGAVGALWPIGDAGALAAQMVERYGQISRDTPLRVRVFFEQRFSYDAIGRRMVELYAELHDGGVPSPPETVGGIAGD
jgi:glycosyltransferase involved in cell wall biosynthesis